MLWLKICCFHSSFFLRFAVAVAVQMKKSNAVAVAVAVQIRKQDAVAVAVAVQMMKIQNRNRDKTKQQKPQSHLCGLLCGLLAVCGCGCCCGCGCGAKNAPHIGVCFIVIVGSNHR